MSDFFKEHTPIEYRPGDRVQLSPEGVRQVFPSSGKNIQGKVEEVAETSMGKTQLLIRFDDGYLRYYDAVDIEKIS